MEKHPLHRTAEKQLNKITAKEITARTKKDLRALADMLKILPAQTETAIWQKVNAFLQAKLTTKNPEELRNLSDALATKLALLMIEQPVVPKEKESKREEVLTSQEQEAVDTIIMGNLNELDQFFRTGIEKYGPKIYKAVLAIINGRLETLVLSKSGEIKNALGEKEHADIIKKAVASALKTKIAYLIFDHLPTLKSVFNKTEYHQLLLEALKISNSLFDGKAIIRQRREIKNILGEKAMKMALQKALSLLSDDPEVISTKFSDSEFSEIKNLLGENIIRQFYTNSLTKAVHNDPSVIFHYSKAIKSNLNNKTQYRSIIAAAAQNGTNENSQHLFIYEKVILPIVGLSVYKNLIERAASTPRKKYLSGNVVVFVYADKIISLLGATKYRQLLQKACVEAANSFPSDIFEKSALIKTMLGTNLHERFLRLASESIIKKDPQQVIVDRDETIKKLPWNADLIEQAARKILAENPPFLITFYFKIKNFPWAFAILKQALKAGPQKKFKGDWKPLQYLLGHHSNFFTKAQILELKKIELETKKLLTIAATTLEPKRKLTRIFAREGRLIRDPALKNLGGIKKEWLITLLYPSRDRLHASHQSRAAFRHDQKKQISGLQIIIARNLFFQNRTPDKKSVQKEALRIMAERERYKNLPLFKDRNVLFAAHKEKNRKRSILGKEGEIIFGKEATITAIAKQGGRVSLERPDHTPTSLQKAKKNTLVKLINTPPPFTFVFDGHGGPDALYFSEGDLSGTQILATAKAMKITCAELQAAYLKRREKFPQKPNTPMQKRDIFILASCFNHTFLRTFYDSLPAHIPKPIIVGCAEYGQFGFSNNSPFGSSFFADTLNLKSGQPGTFQDIFNGEMNQLDGNPSLYIPTENNTLQQLSEREKTAEKIRREKTA